MRKIKRNMLRMKYGNRGLQYAWQSMQIKARKPKNKKRRGIFI